MIIRNADIETAAAVYDITRKTSERLSHIRDHFKAIAHLATNAFNRRDSEALVAACDYELARRAGTLTVKFSYD